ncbi:MAG: hypothetical protein US25_C0014G0009 [Candidatus Moranbacteria bacterium GW2011_GWE1_36_7]|nr:MAG: hypothetical protein UR99_C0054G0006 [Candidatus Moranbacteria bacterium GW2011_GWD2_36_12]KKQ06509.1 MAG: hypothetical protein US16_C0015G0006 [Candidatus Moranbacteria bacterium GW2011_GWE2_36_40]KKQ15081.1 MAG: hypothetical protein US25_C0014G0009 [Candidatus Moranbacteria bacterium GW2011_GWE1_36_7]
MNNIFESQTIQYEIPIEDLEKIKNLILNMPINDNDFSIENIKYTLRLCPSISKYGERNGQPAEYRKQIDKWVIYLWDDLREKIQKVLLFHEALEIYFVEKFGLAPGAQAHSAVLLHESNFVNQLLNEEEKIELSKLRENLK